MGGKRQDFTACIQPSEATQNFVQYLIFDSSKNYHEKLGFGADSYDEIHFSMRLKHLKISTVQITSLINFRDLIYFKSL